MTKAKGLMLAVPFALGLAVALGLGLMSRGGQGSGQGSGGAVAEINPRSSPLGPDDPHPGEIRTSLSGAEASLGFHIFRPHDPLASDDTVTAVWEAKPSHTVEVYYSSGIELFLVKQAPITDPATVQKEAAAGTGGNARVVSVGGIPTMVTSQHLHNRCQPTAQVCIAAQRNPGVASMFLGPRNQCLLDISGYVPDSTLVQLAGSVS